MSGVANKFGLSIRRRLSRTSNGKTLTAGALNVVFTGTVNQAGDYPSFAAIWTNTTTGVIYLVYRSGTDHNITKDGSIAFQKSSDGGTTWSDVVTVQAAHASWVLTGPTIMQCPSGRLLCVYFYDKGSSNWVSYSQYSDDDGATWSSQVQFSTDYAATGQLSSPGGCYVEKNTGRIFKMCNYRPTGTGLGGCVVYEYNEAGDSWSQLSIVAPAPTTESFEEPDVCVSSDGVLYAALRSDILHKCNFSYSLDGGMEWTWPVPVFPAFGKNAIAISPSGTIVIISRKYTEGVSAFDSRTIVAYSFDKGVTWTVEDADTYAGGNMYGGINWNPVYNQFIAVYTSVADGANSSTGPTQILCKRWSES